MSGRSRDIGRGGRGKFQFKTTYTEEPKKEYKKKSINNWNYYIGFTEQASEYNAMTEFLLNYIKQTFKFGNDIAMAIIHQRPITTEIWKPTMLFSRNIDLELKEIENEQFKIECKADYDHYCQEADLQQQCHQGLCFILGQMR
jgi:hypothetical protein